VSDLAGQVAIVTGGASGIGRAVAVLFASKGCRVVIADQDARRGVEVADELKRGGSADSSSTEMDVSNAEQVDALVTQTLTRFGRLDILVNSAAVYPPLPSLLETPEPAWDQVLSVNLKGTFLMCKRAIAAMVDQGSGAIVNVASIAAMKGTNYSVPYGVAKAGVIQLTKAAAVQYAGRGIRVNCIVPGLVDTPMSRRSMASSEEFDRFVTQIPVGRAGTPEDMAALTLFLVSKEAAFINGAAMVSDGGTMAR
jgi:NAD(P)-dependent dehydrogenase (short-subunit alcohol dehydrogenase family)